MIVHSKTSPSAPRWHQQFGLRTLLLVVTGAAFVAFWISLQRPEPVTRVYYFHPSVPIHQNDVTCEEEVETWLQDHGFHATTDVPDILLRKDDITGPTPIGKPAFYSGKHRGVENLYVRIRFYQLVPFDPSWKPFRTCRLVIGTQRTYSSPRDELEWDEKIGPVAEEFALGMANWMHRRFNDPEFDLFVSSPKKPSALKP